MDIEGIRDAKLYTIKELAEILDMHPQTLYKYARSGELKAIQTKDLGKWRVAGKFVKKWLYDSHDCHAGPESGCTCGGRDV